MTSDLISNVTIEQELIGIMIEYPEVCHGIMLRLKAEDFFGETCQKAYREIAKQVARHGSADISTMKLHDIEKNLLMDWRDMAVSSYGFENKVDYIADQSAIRALLNACNEAQDRLKAGEDISLVREGLQIAAEPSSANQMPFQRAREVIDDMLDGPDPEVLLSGFSTFDKLIQLERGQLGVIAARPGVGKSSLVRQIALGFALKGPVLFNTNEMTAREVMRATASMSLRIDSKRIKNKHLLTESEKTNIRAMSSRVGDTLRISEHNTPSGIENAIRIMAAAGELPSVVIVDYIQLLEPDHGTTRNRTQDVSSITRRLKVIAQKYNVIMIALSQFSREAAKDDEEPKLHHLRESGSIEQDANWVVAIHAEPDTFNTMRRLIVLKYREGELQSSDVRWFPSYTLMADI